MSRHDGMKSPPVRVEFVEMEVASAKGGGFAWKRFADTFPLWERVERDPALGVSVNHYSVSSNKWTEGALDAAAALPEAAGWHSCAQPLPCAPPQLKPTASSPAQNDNPQPTPPTSNP